MSQSPTIPPVVNTTMKFILRSPIHGMISKNILLITFAGSKSGKLFTTPVSYSQSGDTINIFTHASWWKNLRSDLPITLRIRGREYQGLPETISADKTAIAAGLAGHLRRVPTDAGFYQVTLDEHKDPSPSDVEKAVQSVVMIRVHLCS